MSWDINTLGMSGLEGIKQDHPGCISIARFFGDCLRKKSGKAIKGPNTLDETKEILDSAWNTNTFTEPQISMFEFEVYNSLFRLPERSRDITIKFDIPAILKEAANKAGFNLKRGDLPTNVCAKINGINTVIFRQFHQQGVYLSPIEAVI